MQLINGQLNLYNGLNTSGSINISGSSNITGSMIVGVGGVPELTVQQSGVTIGNLVTDTHKVTGSFNISGSLTTAGNVLPEANGTRDLGSSAFRWSTIYTSDLSLNNGIGDWTIVEGEDDLFLYNNKKEKVYKFALTEVDPNVATPKKS
jgi:cytoskeletal protein CcmA (bactofilin family)